MTKRSPKGTGQETAHRQAQVSLPGLVTCNPPFPVAPRPQVSALPAFQGLEESPWRMGNPEGDKRLMAENKVIGKEKNAQ